MGGQNLMGRLGRITQGRKYMKYCERVAWKVRVGQDAKITQIGFLHKSGFCKDDGDPEAETSVQW